MDGGALGVLQVNQPRDEARIGRWPSLKGREEANPLPLEPAPVDQHRHLDQLMPPIDPAEQSRKQQVVLLSRAGTVLCGTQNRRLCRLFQSKVAILAPDIPSFSALD